MLDETDANALQDAGQEVSSDPAPMADWPEPNPADYGITLGTDPNLDQCWENFKQCLRGMRTSMSLQECLDKLNDCRRKQTMGPDAEPL